MPTKRQLRARNQRVRVSAAAAEHWRNGRLIELNSELKIRPWECGSWCERLWLHGELCGRADESCERSKALRDELIRITGFVPEEKDAVETNS